MFNCMFVNMCNYTKLEIKDILHLKQKAMPIL